MSKVFRNFTVIVTAITLAILVLGGFLFWKLIPQYYLPIFPYMLLLFYVVTVFSFWRQIKLMYSNQVKFSRYHAVMTFLKLMVYLAFSIIYMANDNSNLIPFVIALFVHYFIYSFLETYFLSRASRRLQ